MADKIDFFAVINNNGLTPKLDKVEDHSGNWYKGIGRYFSKIKPEIARFPEYLDTL